MKPYPTRNRLALLMFACVVILQMASGPAAADDRGSRTLTVTKDCLTPPLDPGELNYCTVTASNFRPLRGAKIRYFGPGFFTATHPFLDSWVVIESDQDGGGTAFGHCLVRGVPEPLGACQFTGGSGSLKGFKADVTVTPAGGTLWQWEGARAGDD